MKAMILAAGLGTRLRPLTLGRPKVLVPVMGTSVLEFWVWQLYYAGFEAVVINAFHLHEKLAAFVEEKDWPVPAQVRVESSLLGTGGGIRNVLDFFDENPFVVINGDILCNIPLKELYQIHFNSGALVSLLLHDCAPFNTVALDQQGFILGFGREAHTLAQKRLDVRIRAFTGVHFIHPGVLKHLEPGKPESIIAVYQQLIREGNPPRALFVPGLFWREMGSLRAYWTLNQELSRLPQSVLPPLSTGNAICVHPQATIASDVHFQGMVVVGKSSRIMGGTYLDNVIVWDHALVERNSRLKNCIVGDGLIVERMND